MVFSSGVFLLLFLPIILAVYYNPCIKSRQFRNMWLLFASVIFYAWGEPAFIVVMLISIIINWLAALLMDNCKEQFNKRFCLALILIFDIGVLFICKYLDFTIENINIVLHCSIPKVGMTLPIGISFFTFQIISYIIDVYCGRVCVSKSLLKFTLYAMLFPQLVAGPIVRYSEIYDSICDRQESRQDFVYGIRRFVIGLGKKVILADLLASVADGVFLAADMREGLTVVLTWLGAIAYTFQIYFDFSGYSDMAIGLGSCFGFHFAENFNYPYISKSITEFWKRWHISLTSWFRDYVYIPLGGNRCSNVKHCFNLFVVWILTGVWHGANWTFIVWGLTYFILQFLEKKLIPIHKVGKWGHIYTMCCVVICWVIFRSESVMSAFHYIVKMFGIGVPFVDETSLLTLKGVGGLLVISVFACIPWKESAIVNRVPKSVRYLLTQIGILVVFIVSILSIMNGNYSPFVYFNF